jgi:hypothetical protein
MDVVAWRAVPAPGFCTVGLLENVDDVHELKQGIPRAAGFPIDAAFRMDPAHPREVKLGECLYNMDDLVVVSSRVKAFLEARQPPDTELLPVTVFNHKNRPAGEFFIVNPLRIIDCIDTQKSTVTWNHLDPQSIDSCFDIVLDAQALDQAPPLFRPRYMEVVVFVRRDLADALAAEGFAGVYLEELDEFEL